MVPILVLHHFNLSVQVQQNIPSWIPTTLEIDPVYKPRERRPNPGFHAVPFNLCIPKPPTGPPHVQVGTMCLYRQSLSVKKKKKKRQDKLAFLQRSTATVTQTSPENKKKTSLTTPASTGYNSSKNAGRNATRYRNMRSGGTPASASCRHSTRIGARTCISETIRLNTSTMSFPW
jgi:hypothetical protein